MLDVEQLLKIDIKLPDKDDSCGPAQRELRKKLFNSRCNGHRIVMRAGGSWSFLDHTGVELTAEKVLYTMGDKACMCGFIAKWLNNQDKCDYEIKRHIHLTSPECPVNTTGSIANLESTEFFTLSNGFRILKKLNKSKGIEYKKGNNILDMRDVLKDKYPISDNDIAAYGVAGLLDRAPTYRTTIIDEMARRVKEEMTNRGWKMTLNPGNQYLDGYRGYTSRRVRFARAGHRVLFSAAVNKDQYCKRDNYKYIYIPSSVPHQHYTACNASKTHYNVPANGGDVDDKLEKSPCYLFLPVVLGARPDRSSYSGKDAYISFAYRPPYSFDIGYIATCLEAAWLQAMTEKLYGKKVKTNAALKEMADEFQTPFRSRNLGLTLEATYNQEEKKILTAATIRIYGKEQRDLQRILRRLVSEHDILRKLSS